MSGALLASVLGSRITLAASYNVADNGIDPDDASAALSLESDGDISQQLLIGGNSDLGDWIIPRGAAPGAYEARMVTGTGTLSTGTADTWQALSLSRSWGVVRTTVGTTTFTGTLEVRLGSGSVLASSAVTLTATVGT